MGTGDVTSPFSGARHALLWHGTAASVIDLQPAVGFTHTDAVAVAGNLQVGSGDGAATAGNQHALLWSGTAASVVDLHSLLIGLGPDFVNSYASDVDPNGMIVGYAFDANSVEYPVIWTPVPEPASLLMLLVGLLTVCASRANRNGRVLS